MGNLYTNNRYSAPESAIDKIHIIENEQGLTQTSIEKLHSVAKWARLLSVFSWISLGLFVLMALSFLMGFGSVMRAVPMATSIPSVFVTLVMVLGFGVAICFIVWLARLFQRYAKAASQAERRADVCFELFTQYCKVMTLLPIAVILITFVVGVMSAVVLS